MSESSSKPWPTSGSRLDDKEGGNDQDLTEGLDLGFDGAEDVLRAWRRGMRPDADLTVSEWADAHRWLSSRAAAEPGRYRTARAPYLREIMDALSPKHPAQRISFMKAAQVGATEAGNNWIGFVIHHAPGPMLAVLPTVEMAKRTSRGRIDPLIEESAALKERVQPARSRDAGNSMLSKEFPGGILVLTGANSATGLRSMPARYVFLDEVDAYPASADEEGDPNSDETLWEPWVDGYSRAMGLRPDAWERLLDRADDETRNTMIFLMALQDIYTGKSKFTEEEIDEIDLEAPDLIPNCVATILHQSRPELAGAVPANLPGMPHKAVPRPGRNDPCSCGSGRKYKQCCGRH